MPITAEMMKAAAASGLSVVCSSCELYWEARSKGLQGDRCLAQSGCGSPLAGRMFHEYRGPMTQEMLKRCCFVCGAPSVKGLRASGNPRVVGVCAEHFQWLSDPAMRNPLPSQITDKVQPNYLGLTPKEMNGFKLPAEHTLLGTMLKTEKEWAAQDGVEFDPLKFLGLHHGD